MKRDIANAEEFMRRCKSDPLLKKQMDQISSLPEKEYAMQAVKLGRMRGLYFNESDWLHLNPSSHSPMKKAA